jgi:hypothetical protein
LPPIPALTGEGYKKLIQQEMIMEAKDNVLGAVEAEVKLVLEETFEELEAKIAPGVKLNHNETLVQD